MVCLYGSLNPPHSACCPSTRSCHSRRAAAASCAFNRYASSSLTARAYMVEDRSRSALNQSTEVNMERRGDTRDSQSAAGRFGRCIQRPPVCQQLEDAKPGTTGTARSNLAIQQRGRRHLLVAVVGEAQAAGAYVAHGGAAQHAHDFRGRPAVIADRQHVRDPCRERSHVPCRRTSCGVAQPNGSDCRRPGSGAPQAGTAVSSCSSWPRAHGKQARSPATVLKAVPPLKTTSDGCCCSCIDAVSGLHK